MLVVWGECIARQQVARVTGLLIVALHRGREQAILAGFEVAQAQGGGAGVGCRDAGGIDQELAIAREPWAEGAAAGVGEGVLDAGLDVAPHDLPQRQPEIVAEAAALAGVVEEAGVRRIHRAQGVGSAPHRRVACGLGAGDAHAFAAFHVVRPEFERAQTPRRARDDHVAAIWRPGRGGVFDAIATGGELRWIGAVGGHDPQVLGAVPVRKEGDAAAVRREGRLAVERHAAGEGLGASALDGDGVEIAQGFEDDRLAVGGDVERHPCHGVGLEGDGARAVGGFLDEREFSGRCQGDQSGGAGHKCDRAEAFGVVVRQRCSHRAMEGGRPAPHTRRQARHFGRCCGAHGDVSPASAPCRFRALRRDGGRDALPPEGLRLIRGCPAVDPFPALRRRRLAVAVRVAPRWFAFSPVPSRFPCRKVPTAVPPGALASLRRGCSAPPR